jgi:hypothetical protein
MLVRLLQSFKSIELDLASAPPESLPPPEWATSTGRKAIEKFFPKTHLTLYANVGAISLLLIITPIVLQGGLWVKLLGSDEPDD